MKKLLLSFLLFLFFLPQGFAKEPKKQKFPESPYRLTYLILSGQYHQALKLLGVPKKTKGEWKNRLRFMAAYLNLQKGDDQKAADLFGKLKKDYPLMDDYIDFYRALALREAGQTKEAIALLDQLKNQNISKSLRQKLPRELALSYCKAGNRKKAVEMFNELIQTEPSDIKAYHLRFDRSQCLIQLGSGDEALITLRALYLNYPEGDLNAEILNTLEQLGNRALLSTADHIQRGDQLMRNNRPALAAGDYEAIVAQLGEHTPGDLKMKLAEAYFKSRQYPEAARVYEEIKFKHPGLFDQKAEVKLAQAYYRSDQFEKALRAYQALADAGAPGDEDQWDYKIAFIHMDMGDYSTANRLFEAILADPTGHPREDQIHWFIAWDSYLLKNYDQALRYLNLVEEKYPRSRFAQRAPYWRARILEKKGESKQARQIYAGIAEKDPFSYYGFISLKRLEGNWEVLEPPKKSWSSSLPHRKIPKPFSPESLEAGGKQKIKKVKELLWLGLWEDFLDELGQLAAGDAVPYELDHLKRQIQSPSPEGYSDSGEGFESGYPPAYATLVSLFSTIHDFPLALIWAIIREESRFRPTVTSAAQAMGLMQIIPPTGMAIAKDLGRGGFVPEDLYEPVTNIEFGVHYLSKNRERFGGDLTQTIASYNAGPDAVVRWTRSRPGRDWDEFIEEIPFKETNLYVKKVLKSYWIYKLMYEGS